MEISEKKLDIPTTFKNNTFENINNCYKSCYVYIPTQKKSKIKTTNFVLI